MSTTPGRRAHKRAAKRAAIVAAATRLFSEQGYDQTTTQHIARVADVADGTVFTYAGTKQELLLMVINAQLRPIVEAAIPRRGDSPEEGILETLGPLCDLARSQAENTARYLQEVLFGQDGPERQEALALVDLSVSRIANLLPVDEVEGLDRQELARWLFASLVTEMLRWLIRRTDQDLQAALRPHIRILLRGIGAAA